MKLKYLLIVSLLAIFAPKINAQCFSWREDFGSEQDARIFSLKKEVGYYNHQLGQLNKIKNYNEDVLLARQAARQLLLSKQSEHQRLENKCFKDRTGPQFQYYR
jgi:hypothetical protein